jgi:phosphatidylethanolamine-binding protein (PEBP) family uncharacterized protein
VIGTLLRRVRSDPGRSPLAGKGFDSAGHITVTSPAFVDGHPIPRRHAGRGVGDDVSPELHWQGMPTGTAALVLLLDDVDVPLRTPLIHSVAIVAPEATGLGEGEFHTGTPRIRVVPTTLSKHGYSGPRPIPGHGAHRYRFHVLALDRRIPEDATFSALLNSAAG